MNKHDIQTKIKKELLKFYLSPIALFARSGDIDAAMNLICDCMENDDYYPTFRIKPKKSTMLPLIPGMCMNDGKIGIILQGPVGVTDMVEESVKFYKSIYPRAHVIVSTWNDEPDENVEKLIDAGAIVVKNKKPEMSGILNINYQLISSLAGARKAREFGAKYIAKTRTDQRICKPNVFCALMNLLEQYPVEVRTCLKSRIIALPTYYGNMFTPFFISDFFYFGTVDDVELLLSIDQDNRKPFTMPSDASRRDYAEKMYPPEIYIIRHFLEDKLGVSAFVSIKKYWDALTKYFIIVDRNMIDLYTTKYVYSHKDHISFSEYFKDDTEEKKKTMNFGFVNWLNLYSGDLYYKEEYEREADISML